MALQHAPREGDVAVDAEEGDLVAALDQVRRRAQHECQQRRPRERLIPQHAGEQELAAAGGERMLAQVHAEQAQRRAGELERG